MKTPAQEMLEILPHLLELSLATHRIPEHQRANAVSALLVKLGEERGLNLRQLQSMLADSWENLSQWNGRPTQKGGAA